MTMTTTVKWVEGVQFVAESGSGHAVVVDGPPAHGGRNTGPRPMELMLMSLGSCSAFDVVHILTKARQAIYGCEVSIRGERAADEPKVFTAIDLRFIVSGAGLKPAAVARAVSLTAEKYCSAAAMIRKTAAITYDFEIVEVPPGDAGKTLPKI